MVNEFKCSSLIVLKYDLILFTAEKGHSVEQLLVTCVNSDEFFEPCQYYKKNIFFLKHYEFGIILWCYLNLMTLSKHKLLLKCTI